VLVALLEVRGQRSVRRVEDLVREKINEVKNTTNSTRLERERGREKDGRVSQTVKERERKSEKILSMP